MPELTQTVEPSLELTLQPLVELRSKLKAVEAAVKSSLDDVNDEIKNTLIQSGVEVKEDRYIDFSTPDGDLALDLAREKSTLDKHLLLEQGVTTEQIKKATKVTTHIQLDVRKKKVAK